MLENIINILTYLISVVVIVLTVKLAIIQAKKNPKKKFVRRYIVAIGIISIMAFPVQCKKDNLSEMSQFRKDSIFEKKLNLKSDSIKMLQFANIDSTNKLLVEQNKLLRIQNDNLKISKDILGYSKGNSFATIELFKIDSLIVGIQINNRKDYPLYEINVSQYNVENFKKCISRYESDQVFFHKDCYYKNVFGYKTIDLPSDGFYDTNNEFKIESGINHYMFVISQRNINVTEYMITSKNPITGKVAYSYRIYEYKKGKYKFLYQYNPLKLSQSEWKKNPFYLKDMNYE